MNKVMGEALYRKYRPKSLSEVVGQPHITQTLENALTQGKISHGYLFSGPRGVGKTSIARILAHQINNFSYGDANGTLDIIEIDAASNRRIDEIRDLRDRVHNAPVSGKYKVYIIDEVHMLTREAFNALLKTLEEPPAHVVFILATTEAHKLPETIVSRTQRFTFKPVSRIEVINYLNELAKKEKLQISKPALELIADHGEGSFRDSISLLDQLSIRHTITEDHVRQLLGIPPEKTIATIVDTMKSGDILKLVESLQDADDHGFNAVLLAKALSRFLRDKLITQTSCFNNQTVPVMEKLLLTAASPSPRDYLELTLLDATLKMIDEPIALKTPSSVSTPQKPSQTIKKPPVKHHELNPKKKPSQKTQTTQTTQSLTYSELQNRLDNGLWEQVLTILKQKYNTLYGVARMARPTVEDGILVLSVPFAFHHKRLSEERNSAIVSATLAEIAGGYVAYKTHIDNSRQVKPNQNIKANTVSEDSGTLQAVTEIFGGGEVLE
jgi:DNA polymerase-3 subunit gamma/tau